MPDPFVEECAGNKRLGIHAKELSAVPFVGGRFDGRRGRRIWVIARPDVLSSREAYGSDRIGEQLKRVQHGERAGEQKGRSDDAFPEPDASIRCTRG